MRKIWSAKYILIALLGLLGTYLSLQSPKLDIKIGKIEITRSFNLVWGLDLAGGSHLVFEADTKDISKDKRESALSSLKEVVERRVNLFGVSEPNVQISSFENKDRVIVELPGIKDSKETVNIIGQVAELAFAEIIESSPSAIIKLTDLTGADLKSSSVTFDQKSGKPNVSLQFTKEGGEKFSLITQKNVGRPLAILLDGGIISSPIVNEKIVGGNAVISGNFSLEEAKKLSIELNAGALPVPLMLVQEETVGASLGTESIKKSINAGIIGLTMVMFFMVLVYGKLGIVADLALLIFGVLTLSFYKLIPITVTLPGIAGFLLSVGMAVDSNILIFERFKEEKIKGPIADALEISFGRAWDSIRDANIATLVTAFVLANPFDWSFLHTSGPVRGFAITLTLGIAISLFTGIVVSRNLLRLFIKDKPE